MLKNNNMDKLRLNTTKLSKGMTIPVQNNEEAKILPN
jgi:hypothetical protein